MSYTNWWAGEPSNGGLFPGEDCVYKAKLKSFGWNDFHCNKNFNDDNDDLETCTKKSIKALNQCIRKCFIKIRITDKPNQEIADLFEQRRILRNKKMKKVL